MQFFNEPLMHDKMGPIQFLHHEIDSRLGHITSKLMNHISNWDIHMTQKEKDTLEKLSEAVDEEGQIIVDPSSLFGKFATIDQIPTKVSQLINDKSFISEIPNYYITEEELEFKLNNISVSKYTDYNYINNEISDIYNRITNEYKYYTDNAVAESTISEEYIRQLISTYLETHGLSVSWENVLNKPTWAQGSELPKATRSGFGTVKIGNGIDIQDGVISVSVQGSDSNDLIAICYYSSDTELDSDSEFAEDVSAYNFNTHQAQLPAQGWSFIPDFSKKYVYQLVKVCVKGENNYWGSDWNLIYTKQNPSSDSQFSDNFVIHQGADGNKYLYSKTSISTNTDWTSFTWLARNYGTLYEACYNDNSQWHAIYSQFYGNVLPESVFQPSFCINLTTGDINTNVGTNPISSEINTKYLKSNTVFSSDFWTIKSDGNYTRGITTTISLQNAERNYSTNNYDVKLSGTVDLEFSNGILTKETWKSGSTIKTKYTGGDSSGSGYGRGWVYNVLDRDLAPTSSVLDRRTGHSFVDWEENDLEELDGKGTVFEEEDNS